MLGLDLLGPECLGQAAVKDSRGKEWKKRLLKELRQEERREGSYAASPSASWLWAKVSLYRTTGSGPGKAERLIHVGQRKSPETGRDGWTGSLLPHLSLLICKERVLG